MEKHDLDEKKDDKDALIASLKLAGNGNSIAQNILSETIKKLESQHGITRNQMVEILLDPNRKKYIGI